MNDQIDDNIINNTPKNESIQDEPMDVVSFIRDRGLEDNRNLEEVLMLYNDYVASFENIKNKVIEAFADYLKDFYLGVGEDSYDSEKNPEPISFEEFYKKRVSDFY